ncbi:MAG TPA: hypothetical protein VFS43_31780 [Polyangiaceae bacterium]|nr:hypothetical protein [Polyangiaceae bacterium]
MSARGRASVASTSVEAREAAAAALAEGGNAFDAAVAGFFAAAGAHPAPLLSPLALAVAGVGQRPTFFDGRSREPGLGVARPTRYRDAGSAPALARLGAPAGPVALAVAVASAATRRLPQLAAVGVKAARRERAPERARAIEAVGRAGGLALQERWFLQELAERAPRIEGALLGPDDLAQVRPGVETLESDEALGGALVYRPGWAPGRPEGAPAPAERQVIAAVDARGGLALALWHEGAGGFPLFEGQLALPALGTPVVSGVARARPGAPVPTPTPLAFLSGREGRVEAAFGSNAGELSAAMAEAVQAAGTGLWPSAEASAPFGPGVELVAALVYEAAAGREGATRHWR